MNLKVQVIIAAGGTGERMNAPVPKPLLLLGGEPVVVRTLKVFDAHPLVAGIVLVVHGDYIEDYRQALKAAGLARRVDVVPGGQTRTGSVRLGLRALDQDTQIVIVHDAVRPFVTGRMIDDGIAHVLKGKAAVVGVPVKPTLKVVDPVTGVVLETLDRSLVWEIQTPQIFDRRLLDQVYEGDMDASDDAGLVELAGHKVMVYMGDYRNIKITTPEDMDIAEIFLRGRLS